MDWDHRNAEGGIQRISGIILTVVSVVMVVYHMVSTQHIFFDPIIHQNIHFMMALIIIFLGALKTPSKWSPIWFIFLALGLIATNYVNLYFDDLTMRQGSPTDPDLVIGVLLVVVAIIATWRTWGISIPALALFFAFYALTAKSWPAAISGYNPSFERFISMLSIGLTGMYGGTLLGVSANYIFLFMVFGAFLSICGVTEWFNDVAKLVGRFRYSRGGPGQTAVVTSGLFGMCSGSAAADSAVIGSFTIPLMRSAGYPPEKAAAIEAAAGSGSQIMPPVMGVSAFVMADILGVSYGTVCMWAAIPAFFYYFSLLVDVELTARREGLQNTARPSVDWREFFLRLPLFAIPIGILIYLFIKGHSASYAAFMAILAVLAVSLLRKKTRPTWKKLVLGCISGARGGAEIAVVCAALAPIWVTMTVTGLGLKLPGLIESLSGGSVLIALFMVLIISIILGMGVPTLAVYLLVAMAALPALTKMGTIPPAAHLGAMYFAVFSAVTPPVAIAAMVTSKIAGSDYWPTGMQAFKLCLLCFVMPFIFVYNPQILLINFQPVSLLLTLVAIILGIFFLGAAKGRFLFKKLRWWETGVTLSAGVLYLYFSATLTLSIFFIALIVSGALVMVHWMRTRKKHR